MTRPHSHEESKQRRTVPDDGTTGGTGNGLSRSPSQKRSTAVWVVIGVFCVIVAAIFIQWPPGKGITKNAPLVGPFSPDQGYAWVVKSPVDMNSDQSGRGVSSIIILEDGSPLGPAHAFQIDIKREGRGAFVHWGDKLYFSTSDNSDPNKNKRTYSIQYTVGLPVGLYLAIVVLCYFMLLFVLWAAVRSVPRISKKSRTIVTVVAQVVLVIVLIQAVFWVLTENLLLASGEGVRRFYEYCFDNSRSDVAPLHYSGLSINYLEHHYLNYALNPAVSYCGTKQFNKSFRIRRSEPIAPRDKVKWRAIVLGGSTTFGASVPHEEDTWTYQLERLVRQSHGRACDVINGGISGYTTLENFIHYITLLKFLEPDLVLLHVGINDVHPRLFGRIKSDYSNYRVPWRNENQMLAKASPVLRISTYYRYYFLKNVILRASMAGIVGVVSKKGPPVSTWEAALRRNSSNLFQDHLESLIRLLKSEGVKVALLPQYFTPLNARDNIYFQGVTQHNRINEQVARAHRIPYAGKIVAPGTFDRTDTADNCHFNEQGSKKMANVVFQFLSDHALLPAPAKP